MTFPDARTMYSLVALDNADGGEFAPDGRIHVRVEGKWWEVFGAEIDELAARGWLALLPHTANDQAAMKVTDAGRYWLKRWAKTRHRSGV